MTRWLVFPLLYATFIAGVTASLIAKPRQFSGLAEQQFSWVEFKWDEEAKLRERMKASEEQAGLKDWGITDAKRILLVEQTRGEEEEPEEEPESGGGGGGEEEGGGTPGRPSGGGNVNGGGNDGDGGGGASNNCPVNKVSRWGLVLILCVASLLFLPPL